MAYPLVTSISVADAVISGGGCVAGTGGPTTASASAPSPSPSSSSPSSVLLEAEAEAAEAMWAESLSWRNHRTLARGTEDTLHRIVAF